MRRIFNKLPILRIDGPINLQIQHQVLKIINSLSSSRVYTLAIIINSCGGSFRSAKAISDCLKNWRNNNEVPIYCFAEDYCLNSANLVLSMGTKSFANKLSIIGDFGYTAHTLLLDNFQKQYKVGTIQISQMTNNKIMKGPLQMYNVNDKNILMGIANQDLKQLREGIIGNRLHQIKQKNENLTTFSQKVFSNSLVQADEAQRCGLIDEIMSFQIFKQRYFSRAWAVEKNKNYKNPYFNLINQGINLIRNN